MELGSSFLFLQEQIKDIIIIIGTAYQLRRELREAKQCNNNKVPMPNSLHGHENSFLIILSSLLTWAKVWFLLLHDVPISRVLFIDDRWTRGPE